MPALLGIALYMSVQLAIGIWVSRRIHTEQDYIIAGRQLGYGLATFSIFATWFGAETIMGSAGLAYRNGVSLGSAEPFGYGLCLILMGLVFAVPLWRRQLTTLADLYRVRYNVATERLAAVILIPSSILWAGAQIRGFGYVITTSSTIDAATGTAIAAGFAILYSAFGGMLVDAINDFIQGIIVIVGLIIVLVAMIPLLGGLSGVADSIGAARIDVMPHGDSALSLLESWSIPLAGSVLATELVGRALAARSPTVARRSFYMGGVMYLVVGSIPLTIGLLGPGVLPSLQDAELLIPQMAKTTMPAAVYVIFAGALLAAILSTVDSTLLTSSALLSHNVIVPVFGVVAERTKVRVNRAAVIGFGLVAYFLATRAEGVFELVEQASAFGSSGALVTAVFALFTPFGGPRAAIATLLAGMATYLIGSYSGITAPYLLSLAVSLAVYTGVALTERAARRCPEQG